MGDRGLTMELEIKKKIDCQRIINKIFSTHIIGKQHVFITLSSTAPLPSQVRPTSVEVQRMEILDKGVILGEAETPEGWPCICRCSGKMEFTPEYTEISIKGI